jgi:hypothetical protein
MLVAGAAALLVAGLLPGATLADAPPYTVIAGGLHNPRGLTFGPGDRLYVAEAGQGGTDPLTDPIGYNGSIQEVMSPASASPSLRVVVSGLASAVSPEGDVIGVDGISAQGNGGIYAIMGESTEATGEPMFGKLLKVSTSGALKTVADVGGPNYAWTGSVADDEDYSPPGEQQYPDSNPYGVLALPGRQYVVDAGANTLNEVLPNGTVRILAFFENTSITDSTPTCVAQGPDGALYIGMLYLVDSFGGPAAKVYRVDPSTLPSGGDVPILGAANVWATGLQPINGCAVGSDALYVSQLFSSISFGPGGPVPSGGDVVRIPFANPAQHTSLTNGSLPLAGGVAVAGDGTVYAVGLTAFAPTGFVARLANR